jgi:hypothetical protein
MEITTPASTCLLPPALRKNKKGSVHAFQHSQNTPIRINGFRAATPSALEPPLRFAVDFAHDVVDPCGVLIGGVALSEVVQSAKIEMPVSFEVIDLVQAPFVGHLEDFALDMVTIRRLAVAKVGKPRYDEFSQFLGFGVAKKSPVGTNHDVVVRALTLERAVNEYFYRIINSLHRLVPLGLRSALALDKGDLEKVHPQRNFLARLGQGFGDNRMVSLPSLLLELLISSLGGYVIKGIMTLMTLTRIEAPAFVPQVGRHETTTGKKRLEMVQAEAKTV